MSNPLAFKPSAFSGVFFFPPKGRQIFPRELKRELCPCNFAFPKYRGPGYSSKGPHFCSLPEFNLMCPKIPGDFLEPQYTFGSPKPWPKNVFWAPCEKMGEKSPKRLYSPDLKFPVLVPRARFSLKSRNYVKMAWELMGLIPRLIPFGNGIARKFSFRQLRVKNGNNPTLKSPSIPMAPQFPKSSFPFSGSTFEQCSAQGKPQKGVKGPSRRFPDYPLRLGNSISPNNGSRVAPGFCKGIGKCRFFLPS